MALPLDKLTIKPASRAQVLESRRQTSAEWAKWLDVEGYLKRLESWELLDHAADGKIVTWVLVPVKDPESLEVLSTCVTYRRDVLILAANETKSAPAIGYGIASVFTPEKYRGKGYATRMMSLLHFAIAIPDGVPAFPAVWGDAQPMLVKEPAILSVLYSGVGDYYSRCSPGTGTGWTIMSPTSTEWVVGDTGSISPSIDPSVEMLSQEEAVSTIATDAPLYVRDFESRGPSERIQFAFRPTAGWCVFQMLRDTDHPSYLNSFPKTWGARIQSQSETHFIVWTYKPIPEAERKLIVIHLRASPVTFRVLFAAMLSVAQEERHGLIEAWNVGEDLGSVVEETKGRTYERKSQLPAVKWYGPGLESDVVWFGNNKLHWC